MNISSTTTLTVMVLLSLAAEVSSVFNQGPSQKQTHTQKPPSAMIGVSFLSMEAEPFV